MSKSFYYYIYTFTVNFTIYKHLLSKSKVLSDLAEVGLSADDLSTLRAGVYSILTSTATSEERERREDEAPTDEAAPTTSSHHVRNISSGVLMAVRAGNGCGMSRGYTIAHTLNLVHHGVLDYDDLNLTIIHSRTDHRVVRVLSHHYILTSYGLTDGVLGSSLLKSGVTSVDWDGVHGSMSLHVRDVRWGCIKLLLNVLYIYERSGEVFKRGETYIIGKD